MWYFWISEESVFTSSFCVTATLSEVQRSCSTHINNNNNIKNFYWSHSCNYLSGSAPAAGFTSCLSSLRLLLLFNWSWTEQTVKSSNVCRGWGGSRRETGDITSVTSAQSSLQHPECQRNKLPPIITDANQRGERGFVIFWGFFKTFFLFRLCWSAASVKSAVNFELNILLNWNIISGYKLKWYLSF